MMLNNLKKNTFLILLPIIILGCSSDYEFPNVEVNLTIPITMPQYNNIYGNLWGYEYLNGGQRYHCITQINMQEQLILYVYIKVDQL